MTSMLEGWGDFDDVEIIEDEEDEDYSALAAEVDSAPVVKFINGLLTDAVQKGVSDIHIEPYEKEVRVRYRIDGALQEVMKPPMKMKAALTSRVKILADSEHRGAAGASGRSHQAQDAKQGRRFPCVDVAGDLRRKDRAAYSR